LSAAPSGELHLAENCDLMIPQSFAYALVGHKMAKSGGCHKINAKCTFLDQFPQLYNCILWMTILQQMKGES